MSALPHPDEHRVTALARELRDELAEVAQAPLWAMPAGDAADALVLLTQARSQLDELAGCDAPPGLTQAHHDQTSWGQGGGPASRRGRLLCPPHHRRIHDPGYEHWIDHQGKVQFTRRT